MFCVSSFPFVPLAPAVSFAPVMPFAPGASFAPVMPFASVAPVASFAPVAPFAPFTPVAPAAILGMHQQAYVAFPPAVVAPMQCYPFPAPMQTVPIAAAHAPLQLQPVHGSHVDMVDYMGWTALMHAASNHQLGEVEALLHARAATYIADAFGCTALLVAARGGDAAIVTALLRAGANPNVSDAAGLTPLMLAAGAGDVAMVQALTQAGAHVNAVESHGATALMLAVQQNHVAVVSALTQGGAIFDVLPGQQPMVVVWAAMHGRTDMLTALVHAGADINSHLLAAVQVGRTDAVVALLRAGADARCIGSDGYSALMTAVVEGHAGVLHALVNADASFETDLFRAVQMNSFPLVDKMLQAGANANSVSEGVTPLMVGARHGYTDVVRVLACKGADTGTVNDAGDNAMAYAAKNGHVQVILELVRLGGNIDSCMSAAVTGGGVAAVRTLLLAGAHAAGAAEQGGETFLMGAARQGHAAIVKLLLDAGAGRDVFVHGLNPLLMAADHGHVDVASVLLQAGADVNAMNEHGFSALVHAAYRGHLELLNLLIDSGAEIHGGNGVSPLMNAVSAGQTAIVARLLGAGADPHAVDGKGQTALGIATAKHHVGMMDLLARAELVRQTPDPGVAAVEAAPAASPAADVTGPRAATEAAAMEEIPAAVLPNHGRHSAQSDLLPMPIEADLFETADTSTTPMLDDSHLPVVHPEEALSPLGEIDEWFPDGADGKCVLMGMQDLHASNLT